MPSSDRSTATGSAREPVELATLRRRLSSLLYESLLLLGVLALGFLVPYLILGIAFQVAAPGWFMWLHLYVLLGAYFVWYWRRNGQTLAMQTWRLKLVDASGKAISVRQGWLRYSLAWPSLLVFGAGLVWALFDPDRQFLHDRLAGTRLVLILKPGEED
ncbi:MAG: RDD family protein [Zoogloea sp.]|nr:RDD family protein [Zoogloea sp.]